MGLISEEIIAQVIDRCDIVEIISSYISLKRAGRNFKANCPFHNEKTPSFVVNPDKQIFHCFGCSVGGNVISFVMKQEHLDFPDAVRILAHKVNVHIPSDERPMNDAANIRHLIFTVNESAIQYYHQVLLSDKGTDAQQARDYLKKRGVTLPAVKNFRLGFSLNDWDGLLSYLKAKNISVSLMEKAGLIIARENKDGFYDRFRNRIMFPIFDTRGQCRAFGARALELSDGSESQSAKYINSPETIVYTKGHHLYGFNFARQSIVEKDCVVVVEGYMDFLMPHQAGVTNLVASLGTALTVEQIRLLRRFTKNVIMLFDSDAAGQSANLRSLDLLIEEGMHAKVATLNKGDDPDSFIRTHGVENFQERIDKAQTFFDYKLDVLMAQFDHRAVEGKAKISAGMIPTLVKYQDAVMLAGYTRRLADILSIPESAILTELNKFRGMDSRLRKEEIVRPLVVNLEAALRPAECSILKLLLHEENFIPLTKEEITPSDFQDAKIRDVISKIYDLFEQGKKLNIGNLIHSFEDQTIQQMISAMVADEEGFIGDKQKIHRDYIQRIKNDRLKLRRQELMEQIRDAETLGDHERLNELKEKFNQLVKS